MDNRPIGIFDSGLGGLTAVRQLLRLLPGEDIVYFGDTGRVPYGNRSRETIARYARQDCRFLLENDVKLLIAACGTDQLGGGGYSGRNAGAGIRRRGAGREGGGGGDSQRAHRGYWYERNSAFRCFSAVYY